jgi:hypothetical protein
VGKTAEVSIAETQKKKEEFPGLMENMVPGNSFPQICVVSVNNLVGKKAFQCGQNCSLSKHESSMDFSNKRNYIGVIY